MRGEKMSENEDSVLRSLAVSVGKLEVSVESLAKKVDGIEKKIDEGKKRFTDKYLFPVLATITAGALLYWFTTFSNKMVVIMDAIARGGKTP